MRKWREWREVIFRVLIRLGFVSAGLLVVVDWLIPETRLRGVGLFLGMVSCTALVVMKFGQLVVQTWNAGGRAEQRRAQLEAAAAPRPLKIVHQMTPR